jgi:hypothetical protein
MARVEVDIEEYLYDVSTKSLLDELKTRKENQALQCIFKTDTEKINHLKEIFGLREPCSKERLLEEIKLLLQ